MIAALRARPPEVGPLLILERGLETVDLVAPATVRILFDQLQLVVAEARGPGRLDPAQLARGAVDVHQRPGRQGLGDQLADDFARDARRYGEIELAPA